MSAFAPITVGGHLHAEVSHWSNDTPPAENTPARQPPPSCFRRIGVRVELLRSSFIRAEVWGELDFSSAAGQVQPGLELPPADNPADGIVDFLARMRITEDRQAWSVEAEVKAHQGDKDGLYQRKRGDGIPDPVIDGVGAMAVIAPLTAAVSSLSPAAGAAVALVGAGLGASGTVMTTQAITLYGVDVLVSHGIVGASGEVGDPSAGERVSVLFDVETQFMVDVKIIRTTKPVKARYKAIGMAATWGAAGAPFTPTFIFDPDKGYTIDAPDGSVAAVSPLDEILRVFGFKVSRDNPMFIEIQFGIGLEIGIITIDTATVRATFNGGGGAPDISISRLRATIDVPGTLHGTGEVSISENLIGGAFDITVTPVSVRIAASLYIAKGPDGNVGVLFGGLVELPVPIVLGSSGLGIYGFLGGMGVNFERVMPDTALPALDWAKQHLANNTLFSAPDAWQYSADHYGFAAGLVLGTVDGGFTLNMKGVLLIEVPGPRIGLIMLANVLSPGLPGVTGDTSATILAVIDLDFGRGTILIALRIDYDISGLITFHVPVTAFFDTKTDPSHWYVELGNYQDPVTVKVLGVFDATGYLGVYGDGKTLPTDPVLQSEGLTFAVGFHVSAVLMGYKPSGLYLEASGGFDALLAPDPMYLGGIFEIGGELRLFIISISAWAKLVVIYRDPGARLYVHGEAHGKVDFFFFSVEGSVELTIGSPPANDPGEPPPLVSGVSLIARSTQVTIEGSASSGPVDGSLGKAAPGGVGDVPVVPIDVVPLVEFAVAPKADTATIVGGVLGPWTAQPYNPWIQVGGHWWRYDVTAVRLTGGALLPPTSPAPAAWWVHGADGNGRKVGLGLLTWVPVAQPAAVPYGENLRRPRHAHLGGDLLPAGRTDAAAVDVRRRADRAEPDRMVPHGAAVAGRAGFDALHRGAHRAARRRGVAGRRVDRPAPGHGTRGRRGRCGAVLRRAAPRPRRHRPELGGRGSARTHRRPRADPARCRRRRGGPVRRRRPAAHRHVAVEPGRGVARLPGRDPAQPRARLRRAGAERRRRHPQARREGLGSDRVQARRAGRRRLVRTPGPRRRVHRRRRAAAGRPPGRRGRAVRRRPGGRRQRGAALPGARLRPAVRAEPPAPTSGSTPTGRGPTRCPAPGTWPPGSAPRTGWCWSGCT